MMTTAVKCSRLGSSLTNFFSISSSSLMWLQSPGCNIERIILQIITDGGRHRASEGRCRNEGQFTDYLLLMLIRTTVNNILENNQYTWLTFREYTFKAYTFDKRSTFVITFREYTLAANSPSYFESIHCKQTLYSFLSAGILLLKWSTHAHPGNQWASLPSEIVTRMVKYNVVFSFRKLKQIWKD